MDIQRDISLAEYTTFKLGGSARFFCKATNEGDLIEAVRFAKEENVPIFVLGGGSNVLISDKGFPGLVIKIEMPGIEEKDGVVSAGAGEMWDDLVEWAVERDLSGIENLSAIPGTVGAAPIQNIGAYGAEAAETIHSVRALHIDTLNYVELSNADCHFSYRDSIFKHDKGRYVVTRVSFELSPAPHTANISYRDLAEYFKAIGVSNPSIAEVRKAVIDIRWKKLPDWKLWGTAGSYFKNPVVSGTKFAELKARYPEMPGFPEPNGEVKLPLGWILDKLCDARGLCMDNACVYEKQALVLVARPGATAEGIVTLARELMKRVKEKTGIEVEGEVEWVN